MARDAHAIEGELDAARAAVSRGAPGAEALAAALEAELEAVNAPAPVEDKPKPKRKRSTKPSASGD